MMSTQKVALDTLLLGSLFALQVVLAEVDVGPIDLSGFNLRRVDTRNMAKQRASKIINDLATGSWHMRESLFVDCNYIKCPAYAHLFKLIKRQQQTPALESRNLIKQEIVESLALVVTYDRVFYHKLFVDNAQNVSANHFMEALSLLEADPKNEASNSDTWLDLAACLIEYMSTGISQEQVQTFLREPKRARVLASLKQFKSIPVDVGGEQTPAGLVQNLVRRINKGRSANRLRFLGSWLDHLERLNANLEIESEPAVQLNPDQTQDLNEARELIESLDDEQTAEARRQFAVNPIKAAEEMDQLASEARKQKAALEAAAREAREKVSLGLGDEAIANRPVELIVPTDVKDLFDDDEAETEAEDEENSQIEKGHYEEVANDSYSSSAAGSLSTPLSSSLSSSPPLTIRAETPAQEAASLALLRFVKMRLETKPPTKWDKAPTLSINLAFNFANNWQYLNEALPFVDADKYGAFVGRAKQFLEDPENQKVANRIKVALEEYSEITQLMGEIVEERRYQSVQEFKKPFERLSSLLEKMDQSFDVDDLRRFQSIWRQKYREIEAMNNFINNESWRTHGAIRLLGA